MERTADNNERDATRFSLDVRAARQRGDSRSALTVGNVRRKRASEASERSERVVADAGPCKYASAASVANGQLSSRLTDQKWAARSGLSAGMFHVEH